MFVCLTKRKFHENLHIIWCHLIKKRKKKKRMFFSNFLCFHQVSSNQILTNNNSKPKARFTRTVTHISGSNCTGSDAETYWWSEIRTAIHLFTVSSGPYHSTRVASTYICCCKMISSVATLQSSSSSMKICAPATLKL